MLKITISAGEFFNEETEEFINLEPTDVEFEHSLVSLSKWESEYQKPFLDNKEKTPEEIYRYVELMVITPNFDLKTLERMTQEDVEKINAYLESPQSATTFGHMPKRPGRGEIITSELIYFWMVSYEIPFECQYWHLNRLFALVKICNIKNDSKSNRSMPRHEIASRNRELNEQRKKKLGTSG